MDSETILDAFLNETFEDVSIDSESEFSELEPVPYEEIQALEKALNKPECPETFKETCLGQLWADENMQGQLLINLHGRIFGDRFFSETAAQILEQLEQLPDFIINPTTQFSTVFSEIVDFSRHPFLSVYSAIDSD